MVNLAKAFESEHRAERQVEVRPPGLRREVLAVQIRGLAEDQLFEPYPHQMEARRRLDELFAADVHPASVVVLPTGAGKTDTLVGWLLPRMYDDPSLRVLWLAHQQQLLDQAMDRFERSARCLPSGFHRIGRVVHGQAADVAVLADPSTDIAAVTIQSLARNFEKSRTKRRYLEKFLQQPTLVVVDEAHHAAAPTYELVLDEVANNPNTLGVVGLTATPWPTSARARQAFRKRFPETVVEVSAEELTHSGILARPVLQTVATGQQVSLNGAELAQAAALDLPPSVLEHLEESELRNTVIEQTFSQRPEHWGKTLVFANSIRHADALGERLAQHAPTKVLHSEVHEPRSEVIAWFKSHAGPCVLVSVGMLTEGVDLPDAVTAFLARPTTSPILLRQMIGRVLRGPSAGGKSEAHLVFFRDVWTNFGDVLEPPEVLPQVTLTRTEGPQRDAPLPEVVDEGGNPIGPDVLSAAQRSITATTLLDDQDNDGELGPIDPLLVASRLIGYYRIEDIVVPIFEHQRPGFGELLYAAKNQSDLRGMGLLKFFDDSHPPYPGRRSLKAVVEYVREFDELPEFFSLDAWVSPDMAANAVLSKGAITDQEREETIRDAFERSVNRVAYPSFERFEEAVEQRIRQLRRRRDGDRVRLEPETPLPSTQRRRKLPRHDRRLDGIFEITLSKARELLPKRLRDILKTYQPPVEWTKRTVSSTWAHWSIRLQGRRRGEQVIRVNRLLRTGPEHIADELLAYLVYHELLHSLLPGQGHDAEFRELEALWPGSAELDAQFATLHERWDLDPDHYDD